MSDFNPLLMKIARHLTCRKTTVTGNFDQVTISGKLWLITG